MPFAFTAFDCSIDSDVFHTWVTKVLLPELPACSVIVMDNATFHKRQDTLNALQAEGHTVLWLPPYSPDFNPIEKTWAWIKRLRKQWRLADVNALLFWFFILVTLYWRFDYIYWRHAVYDFFCDPPLAICDPQGLTLYGYYGKISHQWRWDALEQVTISYDATPFEELLDSSHAILCITLRNTGDGYLPPLKLHVDGLDGASELNALAIAAQRYIDGETPVPVTLPTDWQRDWYKYPDLVQRGNLNHFWLLLPQLLLDLLRKYPEDLQFPNEIRKPHPKKR